MRKIFLITLAIVIVITGGVIIYGNFFNKETLTIEFADGIKTKVSIYRNSGDDDAAGLDDDKIVFTTNTNSSVKLKKSGYIVLVEKNEDYKNFSKLVGLETGPQTVFIDPEYSDTKLEQLLSEELPDIKKAISVEVPKINNNWKIANGKLHKRGEWYSTTIYPNISDEQLRTSYHDLYGLVAKKINGKWSVVTLPPSLNLSTVEYPNIPKEVLQAANQHNI